MTSKQYVEIFNALLTPAIALTTIYIAWQQYQVSKLTLNKDLYDRRLKIFNTFMSYLSDIERDAKAPYSRTKQFIAEAREAEFLFDEEVFIRAEEFYKKGIRLQRLNEQLYPSNGSDGLPIGGERSRVAEEESQVLCWFLEQIPEVRKMFRRHMGIQKQGLSPASIFRPLHRKSVKS